VGCLSGAFMSLMLSRYLFRDIVVSKINKNEWFKKNFEAINEILKEKGTTSVGLLRLTFFPFGLASYVLGVTEIKPLSFMIGTCTYLINLMM
tara:strand:+ start:151 stop:426 length:276 start_codon:yes stop_codon:yes gene_type:complete